MIVVQKERWRFQARRWFVQTSFLLLRFLFLGACLGSACGEGGGEGAVGGPWGLVYEGLCKPRGWTSLRSIQVSYWCSMRVYRKSLRRLGMFA